MQVYENDTICPHSWAQSTYQKVGTLDKAYYYVHGASHFTPTEMRVDDFDRLAIWTPLDALMDYTFDLAMPDEGMLYALYSEGDYYNTEVSGPHVGE